MPSLDGSSSVNKMEKIQTQHTFRLPTEPVAQEPKRTLVPSLRSRGVQSTSKQSENLAEAEAMHQLEQNRTAALAAAHRMSFTR